MQRRTRGYYNEIIASSFTPLRIAYSLIHNQRFLAGLSRKQLYPDATDPTSNNKLMAIILNEVFFIGVHFQQFADVKVGHMTCHVPLCWSTFFSAISRWFLGDFSAISRREIAEKISRPTERHVTSHVIDLDICEFLIMDARRWRRLYNIVYII